MSFAEYYTSFSHQWLISGIVLLVIITLAVIFWKKVMKFVTSHSFACATAIWLLGFGVYFVGFTFEGSGKSIAAAALRAVINAFKIFLGDSDFESISHHYQGDAVYMTLYAIAHFGAVLLSVMFLLNTIGHKLKSFFRLYFESLRAKHEQKDVHIFWSINARTLSLASDIREKLPESRIVFIIPKNEGNSQRNYLHSIIEGSNETGSKTAWEAVSAIDDALVLFTTSTAESFKFKRLEMIIKRSLNVHFYFFEDDTDKNLSLGEFIFYNKAGISYNASQDINIYTSFITNGRARSTKRRVITEQSGKPNFHWNFLNLSELSVAVLKHDVNCHPVSTFKPSTIREGRVEDTFEALILGFGNIGREVFKFFYEFGAFAGADGADCRRNITLVDNTTDLNLKNMYTTCPEIWDSEEMQSLSTSIGSLEYWIMVRERADRLNIVGVCLGDDDLNINASIDLYRNLLKYRTDFSKRIKILTHIQSPKSEAIAMSIAADYNKQLDETGIEMIPFGSIPQIFNVKVILSDEVRQTCMRFNHEFGIVRGRNTGMTASQAWCADFDLTKYKGKHKTLTVALDEMDRRMELCSSEAFHAKTLKVLAGEGFDYATASPALIEALTQTAFLKEKASHELMGYGASDTEDARRKLTPYVMPWSECSDKVKKVAGAIVETSFSVN